MKISKLNITKNMKARTTALVLAGTLSITALTGCGSRNADTDNKDYSYSTSTYAIIVVEDTATILDVKKYLASNNTYVVTTTDGSIVASSYVNTFIFKNEYTDISVEEFAQYLVGSDGIVNHYGKEKVKSK